MLRALPLAAAVALGCAAPSRVVEIDLGSPAAPAAPAAEPPSPAKEELPFLGKHARHTVLALRNGYPAPIDNARGKATLRVEAGKVIYAQEYPKEGGQKRVTQIYSFKTDDARPVEGAYDIPLTFVSLSAEPPGYSPDSVSPWLYARSHPGGWEVVLVTADDTGVLGCDSFGVKGERPLDLTSHARRTGFWIPAHLPRTPPTGLPPPPPDLKEPMAGRDMTTSGIPYRHLRRAMSGRSTQPGDRVTLRYTAWKPDGTLADSSIPSGAPFTVAVSSLDVAWVDALGQLRAGDLALFWVPLSHGGLNAAVKLAPAATLVWEVELLRFP